ncbi:hypothetical protein LJC72_07045 [Bacteroides sp. OttesenSCG-928-D19]|nr:hypothetical protein [Bacteroides sp. OttesenSCG-928-D19]
MTTEFDYYLIEGDNNYMSPLLMNDDEVDSEGTLFLNRMQKVDDGTIVHLVFNPPIPPKAQMTDYLFLTCRAVFSKKIYEVLKGVEIKDFQLVPAVIKDNKGEEFSDYWIAGVYREFAFLDKDKSEYADITSKGRWSGIEKMVIDQDLMSQVPLEERLIYVGKESSAYVFYHKSIVDAIMSVNPTGLVFVPVKEWYNGISYSL